MSGWNHRIYPTQSSSKGFSNVFLGGMWIRKIKCQDFVARVVIKRRSKCAVTGDYKKNPESCFTWMVWEISVNKSHCMQNYKWV